MKGFWEGFTVSAGDRAKNQAKATKRWRENNKERYLAQCAAYSKKWADENRERRREIGRRYYQRHKAKETARKIAYNKANPEKASLAAKRYRERMKAAGAKPKCFSCESVITPGTLYCNWCLNTYTPMKLLGKRIILRQIETTKPKSGIILVAEEKPHFHTGIVVAAGDETQTKPGTKALVSAYQVGEVEWEGEKLMMCLEEELIGIE